MDKVDLNMKASFQLQQPFFNSHSSFSSASVIMRKNRSVIHPRFVPLQTLEQAFLQLCESSDQNGSKRESILPGGALDKTQSFESGRDESRPILGVGPLPGEEIPKCSGRRSFSCFFFLSPGNLETCVTVCNQLL